MSLSPVIISRAADAVIAIGANATLSEIAFALRMEKPVVGSGTWNVRGVVLAEDAEDEVNKIYKNLNAT